MSQTSLGRSGRARIERIHLNCADVGQLGEVRRPDPLACTCFQLFDCVSKTGAKDNRPPVVRRRKGMKICLGRDVRSLDCGGVEQFLEPDRRSDPIPGIVTPDEVGRRSLPIAFQKALLPGSNTRGPQVVIARRPPGRTIRQSSRIPLAMSSRKKIPKTQTTASKLAFGKPSRSISPNLNSMLVRPSFFDLARPSSSSRSARSIARTEPADPTLLAAGMAEAPVPQATSSTRAPSFSRSRSTVRRPIKSQKPSAG